MKKSPEAVFRSGFTLTPASGRDDQECGIPKRPRIAELVELGGNVAPTGKAVRLGRLGHAVGKFACACPNM